jgi:hypothetical protein
LSTIIMFFKSSIFLCFFKTSSCTKSTSLGHQFLKIFFLLSFLMSSNCFINSFHFQNGLNFWVCNVRFCSIRSKFTFISISFKPIIIWMFIFLFLDSWFQEKIFICVSSNSSLCSAKNSCICFLKCLWLQSKFFIYFIILLFLYSLKSINISVDIVWVQQYLYNINIWCSISKFLSSLVCKNLCFISYFWLVFWLFWISFVDESIFGLLLVKSV